jgi:hypothetical protein
MATFPSLLKKFGKQPLVPFLLLSDHSILVHRVNRDDQHLLACAMASDFSVTWQFSQREHLFSIERERESSI